MGKSVYTSQVLAAIKEVYPFVRDDDPQITLMVFGVGELYVTSGEGSLIEAVHDYVKKGLFEKQKHDQARTPGPETPPTPPEVPRVSLEDGCLVFSGRTPQEEGPQGADEESGEESIEDYNKQIKQILIGDKGVSIKFVDSRRY